MGIAIALGLLGLTLGSFGEVLTTRLPKRAGWVGGRSRCNKCGENLGAKDLIPVMSFVIQRGKCRYCKGWIGWQTLLVELMMGVGFGVIGWLATKNSNLSGVGMLGWGSGEEMLRVLFVLLSYFGLVVVFWIDLREQIIPDELIVVLVGVSGLILSLIDWPSWPERLMAAVVGMGLFGLLFLITKGKGIGWGDVKLGGLMGILLGKFLLIALYLAFVTGSLIGVMLMWLRMRGWKSKIALGPFLIIGLWATWLWGEKIWDWYAGLLL
jgi:prepilin signal peptidase PulO-like enzyme (type II secretory pathway)